MSNLFLWEDLCGAAASFFKWVGIPNFKVQSSKELALGIWIGFDIWILSFEISRSHAIQSSSLVTLGSASMPRYQLEGTVRILCPFLP